MKILVLYSVILVNFEIYQCGVVKNLVETVTNEVNKVDKYIQNVTNKSDVQLKDETIERNTKTKEDNIKQSVTNKVINPEQNETNKQNQNQKNNSPVQVNVNITLIVNYNVPNTKQNESLLNKSKETNNINITKVVTDPSVEENSIKISAIDVQKTDNNIKFPGPMNSPIVTYNDGVVIVKKNTTDERVLFPDSNKKSVCPDGMFLTENGFCLIDNNKGKQKEVNIGIYRTAFSGACLQNYGRALDGSCQEIIVD